MKATKSDQPFNDFTQTSLPNGTWSKTIRGKLFHFGGWADPAATLVKHRHEVDALQVGREPDSIPVDGRDFESKRGTKGGSKKGDAADISI